MFSVGTEDEYYGESAMSTEPSDYDLHVARLAEERELKRQVRAFGKESMQSDPTRLVRQECTSPGRSGPL